MRARCEGHVFVEGRGRMLLIVTHSPSFSRSLFNLPSSFLIFTHHYSSSSYRLQSTITLRYHLTARAIVMDGSGRQRRC